MSSLMVTCEAIEFLQTSNSLYVQPGDDRRTLRGSLERYTQMYGVCPSITEFLWNYLVEDPCTDDLLGSNRPCPKHMLWTLFFLRHYPTEAVAATIFHVGEKTFRKWVWLMIPVIAGMTHVVRTRVVCTFYKKLFYFFL